MEDLLRGVDFGGAGRGDLYLWLQLVVPVNPGKRERDPYQQLRQLEAPAAARRGPLP